MKSAAKLLWISVLIALLLSLVSCWNNEVPEKEPGTSMPAVSVPENTQAPNTKSPEESVNTPGTKEDSPGAKPVLPVQTDESTIEFGDAVDF